MPEVIKTTTREPKHLAWLALKHHMHAGGILPDALLEYLWDRKSHDVAMTFVDGVPACVALLADYGQLMVFTRRKYRRRGLARRTVKLLSRRSGITLEVMTGGPGKRPNVSSRFFESLGVEFMP